MSIPDPARLAATYSLWRSLLDVQQLAIECQLDQQAALITQAEAELSIIHLQQARVQRLIAHSTAKHPTHSVSDADE